MEMTQNQVYGAGKEAAANISMETNVGYGVNEMKPHDPVDKEDAYEYIV